MTNEELRAQVSARIYERINNDEAHALAIHTLQE